MYLVKNSIGLTQYEGSSTQQTSKDRKIVLSPKTNR